jgi:hypothetical protein
LNFGDILGLFFEKWGGRFINRKRKDEKPPFLELLKKMALLPFKKSYIKFI